VGQCGHGQASALFSVSLASNPLNQLFRGLFLSSAHLDNAPIELPVNVPLNVRMLATSQAAGGTNGPGNPTLFSFVNTDIDPFFFIDPNFPNADQYSILVSPGVGNVPPNFAVPGPIAGAGLLALIFAGGVLLTLARQRRRI
jgi:hypothetical protein